MRRTRTHLPLRMCVCVPVCSAALKHYVVSGGGCWDRRHSPTTSTHPIITRIVLSLGVSYYGMACMLDVISCAATTDGPPGIAVSLLMITPVPLLPTRTLLSQAGSVGFAAITFLFKTPLCSWVKPARVRAHPIGLGPSTRLWPNTTGPTQPSHTHNFPVLSHTCTGSLRTRPSATRSLAI